MSASALVMYVLTIISALLAVTMGVAWHTLDRPRHALFWAGAFSLAMAQWFVIAGYNSIWREVPIAFAFANWSAIGVALLLFSGFRARSGLPQRAVGSGILAGVAAVAILAAAFFEIRSVVLVMPQVLRAAILLLCISATLRNRRRPQLAEWWAASVLLLFTAFSITVAGVRWRACGCELPGFQFLLLIGLPAAYTGTGLAVVLLLASDLAQKLRRSALEDPLTGVLNRRGFYQAAARSIAAAARGTRVHSVVVADIDHFKSINDRFGHASGDMVLSRVAQCMRDSLRPGDLVGRTGGEEFAMLLKDTGEAAAVRRMDAVRRDIAALELPVPVHVTTSFGVVALDPPGSGLDDALERADVALYASKALGRNKVTGATESAC